MICLLFLFAAAGRRNLIKLLWILLVYVQAGETVKWRNIRKGGYERLNCGKLIESGGALLPER